jgi:hypothetical protein
MARGIHDARYGELSGGNADIRPRRQRSWEVDVERARALRGGTLEELTESQREWVGRSLLRGVRLAQATKLAQLSAEVAAQALQQVAKRYSALMGHRQHERLSNTAGNTSMEEQLTPQ